MLDGFAYHLLRLQQGEMSASREFPCPYCDGIAHLRAGTLSSWPSGRLWLEAWCEDCGLVEKFDGLTPWPGYETLLGPDTDHYSLEENRGRIQRFAAKGRRIQTLRLYREVYGVDLRTALQAVEALENNE
jgi:hypothetical protein